MRKLKFTILLAILWSGAVLPLLAQEVEAPNYQLIRQVTTNSKSPSYYPKLMERYVNSDSTLSLEDYRNLYYGFTLREDFVPYQTEKKQLFDIRRRLALSGGDPKLCPEAIAIAQTMFDDNPFDIPALAVMAIAYLQLGDSVNYRLWSIKQQGLLDAISSSGDGETQESAIHVISVEHEYEILSRMGLEVVKDSIIDNRTEYLKVKENAENIQGIYFIFDAAANVYRKKYE